MLAYRLPHSLYQKSVLNAHTKVNGEGDRKLGEKETRLHTWIRRYLLGP
jgi:hypothetical protein